MQKIRVAHVNKTCTINIFFLQITSNILCNLLKESVCKEYNVKSGQNTHHQKYYIHRNMSK